MTTIEPERELVRRVLPFLPLSAVIAFSLGLIAGGAGAAWSACIAVAIVGSNFIASALSIAWAARMSVAIVAAVALGGFVVRLIVIVAALVALNTMTWFSPLAFALALVPATVTLLVFEARVLLGRMQVDLWSFNGANR